MTQEVSMNIILKDVEQTYDNIEQIPSDRYNIICITIHSISIKWRLKVMTLSIISLFTLAAPSNQRNKRRPNGGLAEEWLQSTSLRNQSQTFDGRATRWTVGKPAGHVGPSAVRRHPAVLSGRQTGIHCLNNSTE